MTVWCSPSRKRILRHFTAATREFTTAPGAVKGRPAAPGCADRNSIRDRNDGISQDLHTAEDGTVADLAFPTPSRRARFSPRPYLPAAELRDDEFTLVFATDRLAHQWRTMTKPGKVAKLNKLNPEPFPQLHPDDS